MVVSRRWIGCWTAFIRGGGGVKDEKREEDGKEEGLPLRRWRKA
jgi:hypothetical protein